MFLHGKGLDQTPSPTSPKTAVALDAAKHQGQERKAELVAEALQADEAKLAKLLARSLKRE